MTSTNQVLHSITALNVQSALFPDITNAYLLISSNTCHRHRYFETDAALHSHWKSKVHKRRCKQLEVPAYTIEESERAAGLGREGKRTSTTVTSVPTPVKQDV